MLRRIYMGTLALALVACSSDDSSTGSKSDAGSGGSAGSSTGGTAGSGTGGAAGSGTGGAAGSGTGGAAGSGGSGGGGGTKCTPSGIACPSGQYCKATSCGTGTCTPIPTETSLKSPVCGCDGVTYWNETVAANAGVSVSAKGECKSGKICGGLIGAQCPTGTYCNYALASSGMCSALDLGGSCWGVPSKCPTILIGPTTRACGAKICEGQCQLIKKQLFYYSDNTCPQ